MCPKTKDQLIFIKEDCKTFFLLIFLAEYRRLCKTAAPQWLHRKFDFNTQFVIFVAVNRNIISRIYNIYRMAEQYIGSNNQNCVEVEKII